MKFKRIFFPALLLALTSPLTFANSIDQVNNSARFSFVTQYMRYKETSVKNGHTTVLDSNKGTIVGLGLSLTHTFDWIYLATHMHMVNGDTPYTGATQQTNVAINNPDTPSFIFDTDGQLGFVIHAGDYFALVPYAQIGYHSWERSSYPTRDAANQATAAGQENYHNDYWAGGLQLEMKIAQSTILSFFGALGRTFSGFLYNPRTPSFPGQNDRVGATYHVTNKPWYDVGGDLDLEVSQNLHLFTTVIYTHFKYGKSETENKNPAAPFNGSDEPDSLTRYITGYLGLGYTTAGYKGQGFNSKNSIKRFHNQVGLSYVWTHVNYLLTSSSTAAANNIRTGRYKGGISGWALNISKTWSNVLVDVFNRYSTSTGVTYTSNSGNGATTTATQINYYRGGLKLGYVANLQPDLALVPKYIFGYEHDNYMIKKTSLNIPQSNLYWFLYMGVGLGIDWQVCNGLILAPSLEGGFTFNNSIYSPLASVLFTPPTNGWLGIDLDADYALVDWMHLTGSLNYRHVGFTQSKPTTDNSLTGISVVMPKAGYNNFSTLIGLAIDLE